MTAFPIRTNSAPMSRDMRPLGLLPMSAEDRRFWQLRRKRKEGRG